MIGLACWESPPAPAALLPVDDQIDSWIVRHPNSAAVRAVTPFDKDHPNLGDLSTSQRLIPISAVLLTSGMISDNRKLREAGWGCFRRRRQAARFAKACTPSYLASDRQSRTAISTRSRRQAATGIITRSSPVTRRTPGACSTFWNSRFHMGLLEPVLYAGAAGITFSRMKDRRHWASDTWVGIASGYAMGRSVAARYARREAKRRAEEGRASRSASLLDGLQLSPMPGGGLALGWSGKF